MKTLLLSLIIGITLASCGPETKTVVLANGALVQARNITDIHYRYGSSVCLRRSSLSNWEICSDGEMRDTVYSVMYTPREGSPRTNIVTHKIGKIVSN